MRFGALRGDKDRMKQCMQTSSLIDHSVNVPEHLAFNTRARDKSLELKRPPMHYGDHLQTERIAHQLNNTLTDTFDDKKLSTALSVYHKTGRYSTLSSPKAQHDLSRQSKKALPTQEEDEKPRKEPKLYVNRPSRLQQTAFLASPKEIMSSLHNKTHFNAA